MKTEKAKLSKINTRKQLSVRNVFLAATFFITGFVQAQTEQTYTEKFDSIFVNISHAQATTGILYDRVVPFSNLTNYNSNTNSSVDTSNYSHFIQSYSELYRAAFINSARLPHTIDSFKEQAYNNTKSNKADIGILHYNFNIMDSVVGKAILTVDNNGLVIENQSLPLATGTSLYLQNTAFVAAPLSYEVFGTTGITFSFNNSFNFDNTGAALTLLRVDFGDGQGFRTVSMGNSVLVSYTLDGEKTLHFIAKYSNGQTFNAYSNINYSSIPISAKSSNWADTTGFDITAKIAFTNYYSGQAPSGSAIGDARIYYSNPDKILRRPVLIVDGFDPENKRKFETNSGGERSLWEMLNYEENGQTKHIGLQLLAKGYDLVMLDLPDGGGYIERNAMVCIETINEINRRLASNGSKEEIVVVGPSMGGQVTRYALAYMEKNPNINTNYGKHNCRLWISFDSPHQGANISLGAQEFFHFFGFEGEQESAKTVYNNVINSVAARQMLKKHREPSAGPVYNTYYNNINAIGYPNNLRKIAISNGSLDASTNGNGCDKAIDVEVLGIDVTVIRLYPTNGNCEIFKGVYLKKAPWWQWLISPFPYITISSRSISVNADPGQYSIDAASGCWYNTFKQIEKGFPNILFDDFDLYYPNHTFMPTLSVLDVSGITYYNTDISNRNLVAEGKTPFSAYWGITGKNMEHISFEPDLVEWVFTEIDTYIQGKTEIRPCDEAVYTVHLPVNTPPATVINWTCSNNLSIVSGNGTDSIVVKGTAFGEGWVQAEADNLSHSKKLKTFKVTVKPTGNNYAAPKEISQPVVWQGNNYEIISNLTILNGGRLTIKSNVYIAPDVKIVVNPGGKLIIDSATLTNNVCGGRWRGIYLHGSQNAHQTETLQPVVELKNNALIENCRHGVFAGNFDSPGTAGGGIIKAEKATFRNCVSGVSMHQYHNMQGNTEVGNVSYIRRCKFETTSNFLTFGGSPYAGIALWGVKGINISGNTFKNYIPESFLVNKRGYGVIITSGVGCTINDIAIVNQHALTKIDSVPNTFTNLHIGVASYNTGVSDIKVYGNIFSNCKYGVYIEGENIGAVYLNKIDLLSEGYMGIYLLSSNNFKIDENRILNSLTDYVQDTFTHGSKSIPDKLQIGIFTANSSLPNGGIYKNTISDMTRGIWLQNNPNLQIKCNTLKNNKQHILANANGMANIQGTQYLPAGNGFSPECTGNKTEILLEGSNLATIFYYHASDSLQIPLCSSSQVNLLTTINSAECPTHHPFSLSDDNTLSEAVLPVIQDSIDDMEDQLLELIDGGNTAETLNLIELTETGEELNLMNSLLDISPFLSEEVLVSTAEENEVLPDIMISNILTANSQAAKSEQVQTALNNRTVPMPDYLRDTINQGLFEMSAMEELIINISEIKQQKEAILTELLYSLRTDTTTSPEVLENLMLSQNRLEYDYLAVSHYLSVNNLPAAVALLNSMQNKYTMTETQHVEYQEMQQLMDIINQLGSNNYFELLPEQKSELYLLAESGKNRASLLARGVLVLIDQAEFPMIEIPETENSVQSISAPIVAKLKLEVSPNPANDYFVITYDIAAGFANAEIKLLNSNNTVIYRQPLTKRALSLLVTTEGMEHGLYHCTLLADGKELDRQPVRIGVKQDEVSKPLTSLPAVEPELTVYPNPATDFVTIQTNLTGTRHIEIYTETGVMVEQITIKTPVIRIPTVNYKRGLYVIRLFENGQEIKSTKIII